MIVINPTSEEIVADVTDETPDKEILEESSFYVEKETGYIYEVKLFNDYAMLRPATPEASANIFRVNIVEFAHCYCEYLGNPQAIRDYLWGEEIPEQIVIDRKK